MRIWVLAAVLSLLACACSESTSELSPEDIATVRATAFTVACLEVLCPGAPIFAPEFPISITRMRSAAVMALMLRDRQEEEPERTTERRGEEPRGSPAVRARVGTAGPAAVEGGGTSAAASRRRESREGPAKVGDRWDMAVGQATLPRRAGPGLGRRAASTSQGPYAVAATQASRRPRTRCRSSTRRVDDGHFRFSK